MGKRAALMAAAVLLIAGGGLGYWLWQPLAGEDAADTLRLHGNVDIREASLAFNGAQRIAAMHAEEGDRVEAGELLAELETERLEEAVARAEARVEAQRQRLRELESGSRPQEIRKAEADLELAQATARNAKRSWKRLKALREDGHTSEEAVDNARAAYEEARARVHAAEQGLSLARLGPREEAIAAARATLQARKAELALARRDLEEAELRAPTAGVIRERLLEPGDMASPQKPAYTLARTDPVWVRAYLPEPQLGRIRPGMAAEIRTDTFPDKRYDAWIGAISPTAEFTPKTVQTERVRTDLVYEVRIHACNPQGELRLGMPATVTIPLGQEEKEGSGRDAACNGSP
ncbi:efflux RND transporter periplasmic adaptor subunit [Halorhodospira neutriphila]|uniref:Hemolysin D n=1 Tax=Halorhodospira neutriphila TaxID=168379 RepID=A0ABS1E7V3_9GAMM|nr:efflux RND transporter periplasmic adaptor subunit [Halorhodospira neutriphila]MBK1727565.1 hemolysin D [Halorhodospira neutriphila]